MTVSTTGTIVFGLGNGSATDFPFTFPIASASDLEVFKISATGVETLLVRGSGTSDYIVNVTNFPGTGSITFPASGSTLLANGEKLRMRQAPTLRQDVHLTQLGGYNPNTVERGLDYIVLALQSLAEKIGRAVRIPLPQSSSTTFNPEAPTFTPGYVFAVKSDGSGVELVAPSPAGPKGDKGDKGDTGASGSGSGDMVSTQNLNDLANKATSRTNLGVAIGSAVQAWAAKLDTLVALTWAANKILMFTSASAVSTLDFKDEDDMASDSATSLPSQQSVKAYVTASVASAGVVTGAVVAYLGGTAPSGWLLLDGKTIGDGSSGGTSRANADTSNLYTLLWNSFANAEAPVSSGRGASAAADFAAHKTITLPDCRGRVIAGYDSMGGTSANRLTDPSGGVQGNTLGDTGGNQTHTLVSNEMPSHTHTVNTADKSTTGNSRADGVGTPGTTGSFATGSAGNGQPHNNVQPTIIMSLIIKL